MAEANNPSLGAKTDPTPSGYINGYNVYDNEKQLRNIFKGDPLIKDLFIPYISSEFLHIHGQYSSEIIYLASRGRVLSDVHPDRDNAAMCLAIANMIGPRLDANCIKNPTECQKIFRRSVITALCIESTKYLTVNNTEYVDWGERPASAPPAWTDFTSSNTKSLIDKEEFTALDLRAVICWAFHKQKMTMRMKQIPASMYVHAFVSLSKQGAITPEKCDSLNSALADEGQSGIDLAPDTVSFIHARLGQCVNETNAEETFKRWKDLMVPLSLRCTLILQQTANTGLTQFVCVQTAFQKFRDFKWISVFSLLTQDFIKFEIAVLKVQGNPFYGYASDLGVVKSTNYRSLTYVAKSLLIKYGGPTFSGLKKYRGFNNNPLYKEVLDDLINAYVPSDTPEIKTTLSIPDQVQYDRITKHILELSLESKAPVTVGTATLPGQPGGSVS